MDARKENSKNAEHSPSEGADDMQTQDELRYVHVPSEKVKTIRVRYLPARPLPPRPFDLEDD